MGEIGMVKYFRNRFALFFVLAGICAGSAVSIFSQPPDTFRQTKNTVRPEQLSASFAEVAKMVENAVVSVETKGRVRRGGRRIRETDEQDFFNRLPTRPSSSVGSGFIVDARGFIVTNFHVVEDTAKITIKLNSGEEFIAKIVGGDRETDIAVIKIVAPNSLPFLEFGDSEIVSIGDWVLAIGSPFGLAQTVTAGIISQTNRETPAGTSFQKFIQTDAAINRGNSGGPLVNMRGKVIGVTSQIATSTGDYNGIGFALPSNKAKLIYREILLNGRVRRGFLGIYSLESVKKEFAEVYGMAEAKGAIIRQIRDKDGAAAKAGLKQDDIIVSFDGEIIEDDRDLNARVASASPGKIVSVGILRESGASLVSKTFEVTLEERSQIDSLVEDPSQQKLVINNSDAKHDPIPGLTVIELDDAKDKDIQGVRIKEIDPLSYIIDLKTSTGGDALIVGDVITRINRVWIKTISDFNAEAAKLEPGSPVVLYILRYDRNRQVYNRMIAQFTLK